MSIKKKLKKNTLGLILSLLSLLVLAFYLFFVEDITAIGKALAGANPLFLCIAALSIFAYWVLEGLELHIITKKLHTPQKFRHTFITTMVGQYFNNITPFASGGQPMQAYHMVRTGVSLGYATSALLCRFIVYQAVVAVMVLIALVLRGGKFVSLMGGFTTLIIIGFSIHIAVLIGLICFGYFKAFSKKAVRLIVGALYAIKLVKNKAAKIEYFDNEIDSFSESFKEVRTFYPELFKMFLATFAQVVAYLAIPYFLFLSFGAGFGIDIIDVFASQLFVLMITGFVPLPGAMGGAEISFASFFGAILISPTSIITKATITFVMILWRVLTFYLPIAIGGIFVTKINKKLGINIEEVSEEEISQPKQDQEL